MKTRIFVVLADLIFTTSVFADATDTATCIKGHVVDDWDAPIITGTVTVKKDSMKLSAQTNNEGYYCISNIDPGTYHLAFSYLDCKTEKIDNVIVNLGKCTTVNVLLKFDPNYDYSKRKPYILDRTK